MGGGGALRADLEPNTCHCQQDAEAQLWLERGIGGQQFERRILFPGGYRCGGCETRFEAPDSSPAHLYLSTNCDVVLVVTGVGTASSASTITALGHDSRFDLTQSYWILAGIAGIDPLAGSIGSGAWAEWVVDATLGHFVDPREMPEHWHHGHWPSARGAGGAKASEAVPYPADQPGLPAGAVTTLATQSAAADTIAHHGGMNARRLDTGLVRWAFELTREIELEDSETLRISRERYVNYPNALRPPFVLLGDNLDGQTYWVGRLQTEWAREWVSWHTGGAGSFATSAMEDTGVLRAMTSLGAAEQVDARRVLVLRTASDYTSQPDGDSMTAAELYFNPCPRCPKSTAGSPHLNGFTASLETAYVVAGTVVEALLDGWASSTSNFQDAIPGS